MTLSLFLTIFLWLPVAIAANQYLTHNTTYNKVAVAMASMLWPIAICIALIRIGRKQT